MFVPAKYLKDMSKLSEMEQRKRGGSRLKVPQLSQGFALSVRSVTSPLHCRRTKTKYMQNKLKAKSVLSLLTSIDDTKSIKETLSTLYFDWISNDESCPEERCIVTSHYRGLLEFLDKIDKYISQRVVVHKDE